MYKAKMPGAWGPNEKKELLESIKAGKITRRDACRMHAITEEELSEWFHYYITYGDRGLHSTRLQVYRKLDKVAPDQENTFKAN